METSKIIGIIAEQFSRKRKLASVSLESIKTFYLVTNLSPQGDNINLQYSMSVDQTNDLVKFTFSERSAETNARTKRLDVTSEHLCSSDSVSDLQFIDMTEEEKSKYTTIESIYDFNSVFM